MFDYVECNVALPDGRVATGYAFQTKSLWRNMDRCTITAEGRLVHHQRRFEANSEHSTGAAALPLLKPVELGDADINYHGDLTLFGNPEGEEGQMYIARFTHGTLEWIKRSNDVPAVHRSLIMGQD